MSHLDLKGFSETARDHALHPRHLGSLAAFNGHACVTGPCGDTMEFWLAIEDETVKAVSFITDGCGSSLACGSMAACLAEGRDIVGVLDFRQQNILDALGTFPPQFEHCALLAVTTLKEACHDHYKRRRAPGAEPEEKLSTGNVHGGSPPLPVIRRKTNHSGKIRRNT
jgi:nitrogen fixation NifU-like protein